MNNPQSALKLDTPAISSLKLDMLPVGEETSLAAPGKQQPLDEKQAFELWRADPNPSHGAMLLKTLNPHIENAVRRHTGGTSPVNIGRAKTLLIKALPRYDGRASLGTFVDRQLLPLQRWNARRQVGARIPDNFARERKLLSEAELEFEAENGRLPARSELADLTGLSMSRIQKVLSTNMPVVSEKLSANEDGDGGSMAGDQAVESDYQLWPKTVYYSLNPINQFIMEHTMGLYGAKRLSNTEIARKLKISPSAVSQRKAKIQQMLDSNAS